MFARDLDSQKNDVGMIDDSLISERFEIDTDYFHIVDESRLFLENFMPLRGIRFTEQGLKLVLSEFSRIFKKDLKVVTFKLDIEKYNISGSEIEEELHAHDDFYKNLNFSKLKKNEFSSILLNIVNRKGKLMHASTFIYGLNDRNEKYIILIDPYFYFFADIIDQNCFIASMIRYFNKKIKHLKIFAQPERLQKDSNSCTTISIEVIRQFCTNKNLAEEITSQDLKDNIKVLKDEHKTSFFKYKLPQSIRRLRQRISEDRDDNVLDFITDEDKIFNNKYHKNLLINDLKVRLVTQFNPKNKVHDDPCHMQYKKLNVFLVMRAYEYARFLILLIKKNCRKNNEEFKIIDHNVNKIASFDPNYWISLLRHPENIKFDKRKIFKIKQLVKGQDLSTLNIQEEDKIIL